MALNNIKPPSAADIAAMWNASGLKQKIIFTLLFIIKVIKKNPMG